MQSKLLAARYWIGALACAGIAGAHWLAYLVAGPHVHSHASQLQQSMHAYWPAFAGMAMAAVVAGLGFPAADRLRGGRSSTAKRAGLSTFALLALLQLGGFSLLEVGERFLFAPGHSLNVMAEPVFWWGLAFQVVVAALATLVLRVLLVFAGLIAELITRPDERRTSSARWFTTLISYPRVVPATGGPSLRGPPVL